MAQTNIQSVTNTSGLSLTVAATIATPTAGNLLVAFVCGIGDNLVSGVASTGNTWVQATAIDQGSIWGEIWYCQNCAASGTTVTATMFSSSQNAIWVSEWNNTKAVALDKVAGNGTTYSIINPANTSATATTTQANELCIAGYVDSDGNTNTWNAPSNGFTEMVDFGGTGTFRVGGAFKTVTATGAQSTTAGKSSGPTLSAAFVALIATFKDVVPGGSSGHGSLLLLGCG
jgi:hypothetical protein